VVFRVGDPEASTIFAHPEIPYLCVGHCEETVKLSHIPRANAGEYSADLNWQMRRSGGNRLIWQSGNFPGFHSLCVMMPELRVGVVILANESDAASNAARDRMANEILKGLDSRLFHCREGLPSITVRAAHAISGRERR
jgi:CubicO group peptidase (beta-lactamase class C family)